MHQSIYLSTYLYTLIALDILITLKQASIQHRDLMLRNIIVQQMIPHSSNTKHQHHHHQHDHHHHDYTNSSDKMTINHRYKLCLVDFSWAVSPSLQDSDRPGK